MILEVSRGHIKVQLGEKVATAQGEMFFPGNDKMGFLLYRGALKFWDAPNQNLHMTIDDVNMVIDDIRADFLKGGHVLEIEE